MQVSFPVTKVTDLFPSLNQLLLSVIPEERRSTGEMRHQRAGVTGQQNVVCVCVLERHNTSSSRYGLDESTLVIRRSHGASGFRRREVGISYLLSVNTPKVFSRLHHS